MMIKIRVMVILLLITLFSAVIFFVLQNKEIEKEPAKLSISLSTFKTSIGWGYKIDVNNKTFVYQPFVPVVETYAGFATKEIAEKTGRIVVKKIMLQQRPSLTLKDLQMAGVNIGKL